MVSESNFEQGFESYLADRIRTNTLNEVEERVKTLMMRQIMYNDHDSVYLQTSRTEYTIPTKEMAFYKAGIRDALHLVVQELKCAERRRDIPICPPASVYTFDTQGLSFKEAVKKYRSEFEEMMAEGTEDDEDDYDEDLDY